MGVRQRATKWFLAACSITMKGYRGLLLQLSDHVQWLFKGILTQFPILKKLGLAWFGIVAWSTC